TVLPSTTKAPGRRTRTNRLGSSSSGIEDNSQAQSASVSSAAKDQRTSKTSQKLVVLPEAERMSKEQRHRAGYKRLTAYCVAEVSNMKLLVMYLKHKHNISPRIFDEAMYAVRSSEQDPNSGSSRSSAFASSDASTNMMTRLSEAEENGFQGKFTNDTAHSSLPNHDGYISSSPVMTRGAYEAEMSQVKRTTTHSDTEREPESPEIRLTNPPTQLNVEDVAEVERSILEDIENAKTITRRIAEDDWEIEECHFTHDPHITYPRIYNEFFIQRLNRARTSSNCPSLTLGTQSTLLTHYETNTQRVLSSPSTLAESGALQLRRNEALKLIGRIVNWVSNVLDMPELFWDEASSKELYDAVREYMEIKGRVQVSNEKLGIASDFLDAIYERLYNSAMERIT
ncbi:DUF155-domain-containing protein, partial [Armillaria novae-zelandiae]